VSKTKELIVDYRKRRAEHHQKTIMAQYITDIQDFLTSRTYIY
jgi:hypothetical protein